MTWQIEATVTNPLGVFSGPKRTPPFFVEAETEKQAKTVAEQIVNPHGIMEVHVCASRRKLP